MIYFLCMAEEKKYQTDTLLNGNRIIQSKETFMFGIDAVLLADFARNQLRKKDSCIDICSGNGIIPLLLEPHVEKISMLEIQTEIAAMAQKSVELNELENRITVINGDLKEVNALFPKHSFNCVTCNPPYMINQHGQKNNLDAKTIARHEVLCNLEDVISAADYLLHSHGKFFMIHRPFRLPEIFYAMKKHGLEPKRMRLVQPFENTEPNLVLIEARKDASPRLEIEKALIVREKSGEYTQEVQKIYQGEIPPLRSE